MATTRVFLPVIKGARVVFDLSSERGYDDDAYYTAVSPPVHHQAPSLLSRRSVDVIFAYPGI